MTDNTQSGEAHAHLAPLSAWASHLFYLSELTIHVPSEDLGQLRGRMCHPRRSGLGARSSLPYPTAFVIVLGLGAVEMDTTVLLTCR